MLIKVYQKVRLGTWNHSPIRYDFAFDVDVTDNAGFAVAALDTYENETVRIAPSFDDIKINSNKTRSAPAALDALIKSKRDAIKKANPINPNDIIL